MNSQEEWVAFYFELGLAISQWAEVESDLGYLVTSCVIEKERHALRLGFFAIENFRSKLQFAESLVCEKFRNNPNVKDWPPLNAKLSACSKKRNNLVHRRVIHFPDNKAGRRVALIRWPKLDLDQNKPILRKLPQNALCIRDVNEYRLSFAAADACTLNFAARLLGHPEPLPKFAEQPARPMTIRSLNVQIHEGLGHPLKPSRKKS